MAEPEATSENLVHAIARFSDDDECWFFEIAEPGDAHCPEDGEFSDVRLVAGRAFFHVPDGR